MFFFFIAKEPTPSLLLWLPPSIPFQSCGFFPVSPCANYHHLQGTPPHSSPITSGASRHPPPSPPPPEITNSPPSTMAPSIEELDATVRTFYEGRGEQVCQSQSSTAFSWACQNFATQVQLQLANLVFFPASSKRMPKLRLTR